MNIVGDGHERVNHIAGWRKKQPFDFVVYFFMIATPLFEIPQAYTIFANQSAENVSLWTWVFFCIDNLVWMVYGFRQREMPLFLTSALYEIIEVSIVVGIIIYS